MTSKPMKTEEVTKMEWKEKLKFLFELNGQLHDGHAHIGGNYPTPEEQAISLVEHLLSSQKKYLTNWVESSAGKEMWIAKDNKTVDVSPGYRQALHDLIKELENL